MDSMNCKPQDVHAIKMKVFSISVPQPRNLQQLTQESTATMSLLNIEFKAIADSRGRKLMMGAEFCILCSKWVVYCSKTEKLIVQNLSVGQVTKSSLWRMPLIILSNLISLTKGADIYEISSILKIKWH